MITKQKKKKKKLYNLFKMKNYKKHLRRSSQGIQSLKLEIVLNPQTTYSISSLSCFQLASADLHAENEKL